MKFLNSTIILSSMLTASVVFGHAQFDPTVHQVRRDEDGIKPANVNQDPCGNLAQDEPTNDPALRTQLTAGQVYPVQFLETINHNSKYRVGFSVDDKDIFDHSLMDLNEFYNDQLDPMDILEADRQDVVTVNGTPSVFNENITVPNITCERCSLQLIQKMYNGGAVSATQYVNCIDVSITGGPALAVPAAPAGVVIEKVE